MISDIIKFIYRDMGANDKVTCRQHYGALNLENHLLNVGQSISKIAKLSKVML